MRFEFITADRIIFGNGTLKEVVPATLNYGTRALLVLGAPSALAQPLLDQLSHAGIVTSVFSVNGEPTIETALHGLKQARALRADVIIGLGGGSALDTGKAIAALLTNPGDIFDYLEVVGAGKPLTQPSAPYIAVPTTAGTGAEVTRNAVLALPHLQVKVSLRSPFMLPTLAIIDPELTYTLPPEITASTGLDALTQCIESFISNEANPLTDALCREGIHRAARSLRRAYENGADKEARMDMCVASLCGGLALANAKLGVVHGLAAPLGGMFPQAPHGAVCARLLPYAMETNLRALATREPQSPALARFDELAAIIRQEQGRQISLLDWLRATCEALHIPPLSVYGLTPEDYLPLAAKAQKSSSIKGNPIPLTNEELIGILKAAS